MDRAFLSLNYPGIAWPLSEQREREAKEKKRGQKVHNSPLFQSTGLSAPHKDLDLWPLWASVHDSRATETPDPIYLFVVSVGVVVLCAHVGLYIIVCLPLSVHLMLVCVSVCVHR